MLLLRRPLEGFTGAARQLEERGEGGHATRTIERVLALLQVGSRRESKLAERVQA